MNNTGLFIFIQERIHKTEINETIVILGMNNRNDFHDRADSM